MEKEFNSEVSPDKNNAKQSSTETEDFRVVERKDSEDIDSTMAIVRCNEQQTLTGSVDPDEFEGLPLGTLFVQPLVEVKKGQLELATNYLDIIKSQDNKRTDGEASK